MKQQRLFMVYKVVLAVSFCITASAGAATAPSDVETRTAGPTVSLEDIKNLDEISIRLPGARVFASGNGPKKGSLKIEVLKGGSGCSVDVVMKDSRLDITETAKTPGIVSDEKTKKSNAKNQSGECIYDLRLDVHEASSMTVELLGYGHIEIEKWDEPLQIATGRGLVGFSQIGDLSLNCKSCDLSGEELDGDLKYAVDNGSIGVSQLTASVEGISKGDVVLTWKKMSSKSHVNIQSKAGDIYLTIPRNHPIALDLKAPRGEIYTKSSSHSSGIPVVVTAEVGTIRLLGQESGKKKR